MFLILKAVIFSLFAVAGYFIGGKYNFGLYGALIGAGLGIIAAAAEIIFRKIELGAIIGGLIGLSFGLLFAYLLILPLNSFLGEEIKVVSLVLLSAFGYTGLLLGLGRGKSISVASIFRLFRG